MQNSDQTTENNNKCDNCIPSAWQLETCKNCPTCKYQTGPGTISAPPNSIYPLRYRATAALCKKTSTDLTSETARKLVQIEQMIITHGLYNVLFDIANLISVDTDNHLNLSSCGENDPYYSQKTWKAVFQAACIARGDQLKTDKN